MTRDRSLVLVFCALMASFLGANAIHGSGAPAASARWPVLRIVERPGSGGLRLLDVDAVKSSVAQLPAVRFLRQIGNSARVVLGQRLDWVFFGNAAHPSVFLSEDLWVAGGVTDATKERVQAAASRTSEYVALLQREGWTVIMVLVPPKISVYPEWVDWPILAADPLSRRPLAGDRSAELIGAFTGELQRRDVRVIDLYTRYRSYRTLDPGALLYPPAESHWSGLGLQLAAEDTADLVARTTPISRRFPRYATLDVRNAPDLFLGFDTHPWFPGPLFEFASYDDRLVIGEMGMPYFRSEQKESLVVVVGTSFTGQYTWHIGKPVGFPSAIANLLEHAEVQNQSRAGGGSGESIMTFVRNRSALIRDFELKTSHVPGSYPRVVIWEHPIRDILVLPSLPPVASSGGSLAPTPPPERAFLQPEECVGCSGTVEVGGLFGPEKIGSTTFRWAGPLVTVQVTPRTAGPGKLVLRLLTPYVPTSLRLMVEMNGAPDREVVFTGCNFASPTEVAVPVMMKPGVNAIRLRFPSSARAAFRGDSRDIAYGLVTPITLLPK